MTDLPTIAGDEKIYDVYTVLPGSVGNVLERHTVNTASGGGTSNSRYYQYNHRGDVVMVTNASGGLEWAQDYTAFGHVASDHQRQWGGEAVRDDLMITGKDWDEELVLYYFNARWYDPELGRFISQTPLAPWVEEAYVYCHNNPVMWVDYNGLEPDKWDGIFPIIGRPYYPGIAEGNIIANSYFPMQLNPSDMKPNMFFAFRSVDTYGHEYIALPNFDGTYTTMHFDNDWNPWPFGTSTTTIGTGIRHDLGALCKQMEYPHNSILVDYGVMNENMRDCALLRATIVQNLRPPYFWPTYQCRSFRWVVLAGNRLPPRSPVIRPPLGGVGFPVLFIPGPLYSLANSKLH